MVRLVLLAALFAGCNDDGGYSARVGDMVAVIEVTHDPTVRLSATFQTVLPENIVMRTAYRGSTHVLDGLDQTDPKTQQQFTSVTFDFGEPSVPEEPLEFSLSDEETTAISSVNLPPVFTIDGVTGSLMQSPLTVTWSPTSGDMMAWSYVASGASNHSCAVLGLGPSGAIPDTGMLVIDTSHVGFQGMGFPCSVSMSLSRTRKGSVSLELKGGSMRVLQTKTFFD